MGSSEATIAVADTVGSPGGACEELAGSLQGWKRKLSETRGGTPKKKVVSFLTPDGEEIRNKTQLNKYLKAHPGTVVVTDFDWGSPAFEPVTPNVTRRSARLSMKGRSLFEAIDKEMEPKTPVKKARKSRHNGTANKDESLAKGEPANKTGPAEPMDISEDQSLPVTQKEIIETNGNHKAPTVDIPSAEAPAVAETKELTARTQAINSEAEIKTDLENSIDKAM
ncbi:methyl-CpG-binding domain-containing protein 10 [Physcomitrium patens]|uniref:MBD domain-containing protein n=1 Tax=Physcomitrium patens TaxID=3218 RepID=A9S602_PHYPA|nr:methyl-CpG-binding domain-containing protein 10-like [Physcomitrium patens]XP_024386063.1 methyl-CpG-binding domain-containing protein 10-like [Physcomitrium patens]PNR46371.1 hypothetical protein PHYPA_013490 [Physcomitrium patens]|eukprot:XP_024386062.1 methyl-CpG-binding domain-containing protein 10-like [Physcomitrella patens]